jgi:hypothetical protein
MFVEKHVGISDYFQHPVFIKIGGDPEKYHDDHTLCVALIYFAILVYVTDKTHIFFFCMLWTGMCNFMTLQPGGSRLDKPGYIYRRSGSSNIFFVLAQERFS